MLRQAAIESMIVLGLTTLLLALAATAGLPGRRVPQPAEAAVESPPPLRFDLPERFESFPIRR